MQGPTRVCSCVGLLVGGELTTLLYSSASAWLAATSLSWCVLCRCAVCGGRGGGGDISQFWVCSLQSILSGVHVSTTNVYSHLTGVAACSSNFWGGVAGASPSMNTQRSFESISVPLGAFFHCGSERGRRGEENWGGWRGKGRKRKDACSQLVYLARVFPLQVCVGWYSRSTSFNTPKSP